MSPRWEDAEFAFPVAGLDSFLLWAADLGASDVSFQTASPAFIELDGALHRATGAVLDGVAMGRLCGRVFDETGEGILRSGRAIDCSYAIASGPREFRRFRCNLSPVLAGHRFGINITMRVLPDSPPTLEELGIEPEVAEAWDLCRGPHPGDRGAGLGQVHAAGRRHAAPSGKRRRTCARLRGADRVRVRRHRRRPAR